MRRAAQCIAIASAALAIGVAPAAAAPALNASLTVDNDLSDVQAVYVDASSGQFRLTFGAGGPGVGETGDISATAAPAEVEAALNSLTNITGDGGGVTVVKPPVDSSGILPYLVAFDRGPLAVRLQPLMKAKNGSVPLADPLYGGGPAWAYVETRVPGGLSRSDERVDYTLKVRNEAGPATFDVGNEVTCAKGSNWTPASGVNAPSFTYEWLRNGAPIPGAEGETYVVVPADAGAALQCVVVGSNANATVKAASLNPAVISPPSSEEPPKSGAPGADSRPRITGTGSATRNCQLPSNWEVDGVEFDDPADFSLQWLRNGQAIGGATSTTYAPALSAIGTGTWTSGSTQVTVGSTSSGAFEVGQRVSGNGIRTGTTITAMVGNVLTLSVATTGAGNNAALMAGPDAGVVLQCEAAGHGAGGTTVAISNNSVVGTVPSPPSNVANAAADSVPHLLPQSTHTSGEVTAIIDVPAGSPAYVHEVSGGGWTCVREDPSATGPTRAKCTRSDGLAPGASYPDIQLGLATSSGQPVAPMLTAVVDGGGSAPAEDHAEEIFGDPFREFGVIPGRFTARAIGSDGEDFTQAGGHPALAYTSFSLNRFRRLVKGDAPGQWLFSKWQVMAPLRGASGDIPPGFIGNPRAVPDLCPRTEDMLTTPPSCPPGSVVGELALQARGLGDNSGGMSYKRMILYAIAPERGVPAQFAAAETVNKGIYTLTPHLRPGDGYGITVSAEGISPEPLEITDVRVTLCGYGVISTESGTGFRGCRAKGEGGASSKPFLTSQTECASAGPVTKLRVDSWEEPGQYRSAEAVAPKMTGCDLVPFDPTLSLQPTQQQAESASGLDVELSIPSDGLEDPDGLSQSHLKRTTVTLPAGMSVNPGAADGLAACTQAQLGMSNGVPNNEPVRCPDASKIGTATVKTPILEETLTGNIYLAKQGENPFGTLMALYLVVESKERGVLIKIPGKVEFKGNGQVVSTFDDNPQAPFSSLKLHFNSGPRASLLTPARCGTYQIVSQMTPWSAADPDNPTPAETRTQTSTFQVTSGPGGGPCPDGSLQPQFKAGLTNFIAGGSSPFVMNIARADATQRFNGLDLTLPPGMTAKLKGVPYCPDAVLNSIPGAEGTGAAELANPSCPAASRLGSVAVGAGAGKPFYVNTGSVYLAGPYKGAPVSLAAVVPAVAGPFDLGNVVVRSAVYVNPKTTQITVKTDPLPTHLHGVPLDVRDMRVTVDRPDFTRAPTNCNEMAVTGVVYGEHGAAAPVSNRFQVGECGSLGFKPKMQLRLKGGTARNKYQQLTATVWARKGDANISRAAVTFPRSIFLAQEHIRTVCTRVQFAANNCPKGSIYGRAEAISPLLDEPLKGPVYLRSSDNLLPDLVAALQGPAHQPIKVELSGRTDSKNKGLRNTFDIVPDAPVTKFTLRMQGGKKSLLVTSRNICKRKERATVRLNGQNGRRHNFRQTLKVVKCKKAKKKAPARHRRR